MSIPFKIGSIPIGEAHPPFIIAEMSGNHNQSIEKALQIVDAAAEAGAHAIKLQTYTADTITLDVKGGEFEINDPNSPWTGRNLHDLYNEASTPWDWHARIMERAKEKRLICFSSPFDETAVDFLETLDVPAYKIASFENNHLPLIRKVAATGKPLIISTGMATQEEIQEAVDAARQAGCQNLCLLKCTSTYPASPKNSNISTIRDIKTRFGCEAGLSDHTMGVGVSVAAIAKGATIIEKHFTLARADGGVDSSFSLEPAEMELLVAETKRAWESLGTPTYGTTEAEKKSLMFRRSIYVSEDIKAGTILNEKNLRIVRPSLGLHPRNWGILLGKTVVRDIPRGEPANWDMIQPDTPNA
jgi:N-acetylneuraminate synthase